MVLIVSMVFMSNKKVENTIQAYPKRFLMTIEEMMYSFKLAPDY